jgi:hypothetical protein
LKKLVKSTGREEKEITISFFKEEKAPSLQVEESQEQTGLRKEAA